MFAIPVDILNGLKLALGWNTSNEPKLTTDVANIAIGRRPIQSSV